MRERERKETNPRWRILRGAVENELTPEFGTAWKCHRKNTMREMFSRILLCRQDNLDSINRRISPPIAAVEWKDVVSLSVVFVEFEMLSLSYPGKRWLACRRVSCTLNSKITWVYVLARPKWQGIKVYGADTIHRHRGSFTRMQRRTRQRDKLVLPGWRSRLDLRPLLQWPPNNEGSESGPKVSELSTLEPSAIKFSDGSWQLSCL